MERYTVGSQGLHGGFCSHVRVRAHTSLLAVLPAERHPIEFHGCPEKLVQAMVDEYEDLDGAVRQMQHSLKAMLPDGELPHVLVVHVEGTVLDVVLGTSYDSTEFPPIVSIDDHGVVTIMPRL